MSHYDTLGVSKTADEAELKSAFRKLAMRWHPDKNPGDPSAEKRFKEINEAYETLKDPQKRAAYDYESKPKFDFSSKGFGRNDHFSDLNDIQDILRKQYGTQGDPFGDMFSHRRPLRNKDIGLKYKITLEESFTGKEATLMYSTANKKDRTITCNIPRSVTNGVKIRYPGQGDDALQGQIPGDVLLEIQIEDHPRFIRDGFNVNTSVEIDFIDAMLGCNRAVPCIDGDIINLRIHAGLKPHAVIRVPERGFWTDNGKRASMMVEVVMVQPKLNQEQVDHLIKAKAAQN